VVRGADLLATTGAQLQVIHSLGLNAPNYAHIPVASNVQGQKLSKQTMAQAIQTMNALDTLKAAWHFLGQSDVQANTVKDFWDSAISLWNLARVPKCSQVQTEIN
jgi:glutamyl-Q tRNA(Asp) synthetase